MTRCPVLSRLNDANPANCVFICVTRSSMVAPATVSVVESTTSPRGPRNAKSTICPAVNPCASVPVKPVSVTNDRRASTRSLRPKKCAKPRPPRAEGLVSSCRNATPSVPVAATVITPFVKLTEPTPVSAVFNPVTRPPIVPPNATAPPPSTEYVPASKSISTRRTSVLSFAVIASVVWPVKLSASAASRPVLRPVIEVGAEPPSRRYAPR